MTNPKFIAFYLPQYHPIPENDEWWGLGFTEWVNVAQTRPLFRGHYQPKIPADLGFYDLRLPEIREKQAELAREAGISAFCYWHYWFGNGKQLLERPFNEVLESGKPDFPFCLAWGNHTWSKKQWEPKNPEKDVVLMKQEYHGVEDYRAHFYSLLPAFKDHRYFKVDGKALFVIYSTDNTDDIKTFTATWRKLAKENGLNDFFFVATDSDCRRKDEILTMGIDAIYDNNVLNVHHHLSMPHKVWLYLCRTVLKRPSIFKYKEAIKHMVTENAKRRDVIPTIAANWDHSPRSAHKGMILTDCEPKYFQQVAEWAIEAVNEKPEDEQIIFVKSWNEWGEGNYLEPDLKYGHGYLQALRRAIEKYKTK